MNTNFNFTIKQLAKKQKDQDSDLQDQDQDFELKDQDQDQDSDVQDRDQDQVFEKRVSRPRLKSREPQLWLSVTVDSSQCWFNKTGNENFTNHVICCYINAVKWVST